MFKVMQAFGHQPSKKTTVVYLWKITIYRPHLEPWRSVLYRKFCYKLKLLLGGAFCVGNSDLQTQFAARRSVLCGEIPIYGVLCGKYLFTNPICCLEEHFVWEIPICKLDWSVSCGKFLFAISIGCICSSLASVSYREKLGTGSTTPSLFLTSGRKVQQVSPVRFRTGIRREARGAATFYGD